MYLILFLYWVIAPTVVWGYCTLKTFDIGGLKTYEAVGIEDCWHIDLSQTCVIQAKFENCSEVIFHNNKGSEILHLKDISYGFFGDDKDNLNTANIHSVTIRGIPNTVCVNKSPSKSVCVGSI